MVELAELVGVGTVLESPGHGPQLCLGPVMLSLPPQGWGPSIPNWDWSTVSAHTTVSGTTWGTYEVVGTYDGSQFTVTRPPSLLPEDDPASCSATDYACAPCTPCPEPEGGWRVLDSSRTTDEHMEETFLTAEKLKGYAGSWVDQSINPASRSHDEDDVELMNDPEKLIINVAVTTDPDAAEQALRTTWGGALCVSRARHTEAELEAVLEEVIETPGVLTGGVGHDQVDLEVIYDDGSLQQDLDRRYGASLVVVTSALRPFTG